MKINEEKTYKWCLMWGKINSVNYPQTKLRKSKAMLSLAVKE